MLERWNDEQSERTQGICENNNIGAYNLGFCENLMEMSIYIYI